MANIYHHCPNCGTTKEGEWIRKCNNCGALYCDSCRDGFTFCPRCGSNDQYHIGTIEHDS